jgi:hypothetical protein
MSHKIPAIALVLAVCATLAAVAVARTKPRCLPEHGPRYLPEYTASGDLILPNNNIWREWVFVGAPLSPSAFQQRL